MADAGTFKLDPAANPKEIDVIGDDQKGRVGIYRRDGDRLEVCMGEEKERPTEFRSVPGTTRMAVVLRRVRPPATAPQPDPSKKP